ncbi:hypothetical protein [Promicromonospora sp. NPDC019610]|uniref:hypothetical protein n=1 Tax=Promicromonospora sp. NPDC019610 TaxID=3364405 RepID=UPI0037ABA9C9
MPAAVDPRLGDEPLADVPFGAAPHEHREHGDGHDDGDQRQVAIGPPPSDAVDERIGEQGTRCGAETDDARADGQRPVVWLNPVPSTIGGTDKPVVARYIWGLQR